MRRRLLVVLSVLSLLAVAAFVVPLLQQRSAARAQEWSLARAAALDRFVALAAQPAARTELERLARRYADLYGEGVLVVDGARRPVVSAGLAPDDPGVGAGIDAALRNQPAVGPRRLTPLSTDPVLLWRPVGTGTRAEGAVLLRADPSRAAADVVTTWTAVVAGGIAAALLFAVLALVLARWVLRPVAALSRGVGAVAAGAAGAQIPTSVGPVELRELAESFNRMSQAVRAGLAEQQRLVADASHQIRNPLAALRLRVDGLDVHVGDGGRAAYASTLREVERLERLLEGMLDLAAAEATASAVAAGSGGGQVCDVAATAAGRVATWRPAADAAGVRLTAAGAADLCVAWPEADLEQVLDVLLDNAIRHTGPGSTVDVRWSGTGAAASVVVADDGPGIPPGDLARAVGRFWRGASSPPGGSGLGLAIADRLVTAHAATLELQSPPGGGLRATVTIGRT